MAGSFLIISKGGSREKRVEAHEGAVICLRWNFEGTALATGGEDGIVKIWSQSGIHRSTLATTGYSIYAIAWGPDSDQLLFTHGTVLVIRPIQSTSKQVEWEGHESLVLTLDWNPVNNCILSAGEDCRYKVWDCYGRLLYRSSKFDYSITSVAWCPSGELFSVASFGIVLLCDKSGWVFSKERLDTGLMQRLAWSKDGTQIAGAAGNGCVVFGQLVARQVEWKRIIATLEESNRIRIQDVLNETVEELDFRDRIIKMSLNANHLVVATATQCCIYSTSNWNTPHIFEIKDTIILLKLCRRYFLMVDAFCGLQLFTYEGRHLSNPKYQGLRAESLNDQIVSLSDDILAITDHSDNKTVIFLDASKGKQVGELVRHTLEIVVISLSQMRSSTDQKLIFIDRNQDLYITPIFSVALFKLATMIDDAIWNDSIDILAAVSNQKMIVLYYPHAAYVDKDLLKYVKLTKECLVGENAKFQSFHGSRCTIRRKDGATYFTDISPYAFLLFEHVVLKQWDQAIRLCRYAKDNILWACLAAMAVDSKELNTAEMAYAALNEVDKVHYMLHVKDLPSEDARQAELALFKRRPEEAESILLQAGLIYRAIKMHTRLFNWDRALELALLHKQHLDTVLWIRQQYLKRTHVEETKQQFRQLNQQVQIDLEKILAKIDNDKERESHCQRASGHQTSKHQLVHAVTLVQGPFLPKGVSSK
ncbi:hypothetical protein Mp_5g08460 [Marchantia polymorpha subsp. ruderalis]|uniref:Intraflagellar transport protein 80 homolog n=2 Tax=Marchantia polymorpha TaxID=3197 RepID=A0AAF6BG96_MARPO|nr:hypothetical protein MARPO_0086s0050 [Marchantia polymorpha]BBN11030.1 hypothetical protein Mp_5g08460 [Marchantia polymorpha subsp. ruderalis]|eukprot:PTQ33728.1 hypothetical protein MARPO_0086s0050 [Marchantia polymorpha]